MKMRTLKEWNKRGRVIIKGSKSCGRNEFNEPVFSRSQTTQNNWTSDRFDYYERSTNYSQGRHFFGGEDPDPMDYDLGLCGQE